MFWISSSHGLPQDLGLDSVYHHTQSPLEERVRGVIGILLERNDALSARLVGVSDDLGDHCPVIDLGLRKTVATDLKLVTTVESGN